MSWDREDWWIVLTAVLAGTVAAIAVSVIIVVAMT